MPYGQVNTHAPHVTDIVDIRSRAQANFAYTGTAADVDDLAEGQYDVWSDQDCYIKVHPTDASDVTTATGYLLRANNTIPVLIRPLDHLGAIRSAASGTLYYHQIG